MIDKVADRSNVYSSVEAWDGGAPRVVADYAEAIVGLSTACGPSNGSEPFRVWSATWLAQGNAVP